MKKEHKKKWAKFCNSMSKMFITFSKISFVFMIFMILLILSMFIDRILNTNVTYASLLLIKLIIFLFVCSLILKILEGLLLSKKWRNTK